MVDGRFERKLVIPGRGRLLPHVNPESRHGFNFESTHTARFRVRVRKAAPAPRNDSVWRREEIHKPSNPVRFDSPRALSSSPAIHAMVAS
jgi:hypothetical protein